jgi:hypothetical protein
MFFALLDGRKLAPFAAVKRKYIPMGTLLGGIIFKM